MVNTPGRPPIPFSRAKYGGQSRYEVNLHVRATKEDVGKSYKVFVGMVFPDSTYVERSFALKISGTKMKTKVGMFGLQKGLHSVIAFISDNGLGDFREQDPQKRRTEIYRAIAGKARKTRIVQRHRIRVTERCLEEVE